MLACCGGKTYGVINQLKRVSIVLEPRDRRVSICKRGYRRQNVNAKGVRHSNCDQKKSDGSDLEAKTSRGKQYDEKYRKSAITNRALYMTHMTDEALPSASYTMRFSSLCVCPAKWPTRTSWNSIEIASYLRNNPSQLLPCRAAHTANILTILSNLACIQLYLHPYPRHRLECDQEV